MTLKSLKGNLKAWITFAPTSRPRKILKKYISILKSFVQKHPKVKHKILFILNHFPRLKQRLQAINNTSSIQSKQPIITVDTLSPRSKKIYYSALQYKDITL